MECEEKTDFQRAEERKVEWECGFGKGEGLEGRKVGVGGRDCSTDW